VIKRKTPQRISACGGQDIDPPSLKLWRGKIILQDMTCSQGIIFADKYQECVVGGKRLRKK